MVQEFAKQGYWLPGGGLDEGESLAACAVREGIEEAGLAIDVKGLLQVGQRLEVGGWRLEVGGQLQVGGL